MTDDDQLLVIAGGVWIGGDRIAERRAVRLAGGRIVWIGPAADAPADLPRVEHDGVLVPGVVDHHVHIALEDPAAVLRGGVTTVRDLAWAPWEILPLARRSRHRDFDGPLVLAAGPMLTTSGGYPTCSAWAPGGTGLELGDPGHARGVVATLARSGVAMIKIALNAAAGPTLSDEVAAAVCAAAHAERLTVVAHVEGHGQALRALRVGVDELAHTPWTERLDDELIVALAQRIRIVSTLDIHGYGKPTDGRAVADDNLRRFHAAGGTVVYGTDLGNGPLTLGVNPRELAGLRDAGLNPAEVLTAATAGPVAVGARGDLLLLDGDPLSDADWPGRIDTVIRAGRVVVDADR